MCRYTTTNLTTTECALFRAGGVAHTYTKWVYWLCRDSHNGQPCSNQRPKEDQIGNDFGSRVGPCPVCENMRAAEEKYKSAVQRATEIYNGMVKRAYDAHVAETNDAGNDVETVCVLLKGRDEHWANGKQVPYSYRRREHHHRHSY